MIKCWRCGLEFNEKLIISVPLEYKSDDGYPACPGCIEHMEFEDYGYED
jgi:hypothetical protein